MKKKIVLITGGQRSGKSSFAEQLALKFSPTPVYMATAQVLDDEMQDRVARHRARRGPQWTNIEEPLHLSKYDVSGRTVLVDCITLWSTNALFANGEVLDDALSFIKVEFDRLTAAENATFVFVTNEIGSGGIADNQLTRKFTDLQGFVNQYVAQKSDEVYLMVSGIPVKIKG